MKIILYTLAAIGIAAVIRQLLRSAFSAVRHGAYTIYAREIAANRERRGDLTGLEEARGWVDYARRGRLRGALWATFWLALLIVPNYLLAEPVIVYALYPLSLVLPPGSIPRGGGGAPTGGEPW